MKTILIASDHAGFGLKEKIKPFLSKIGFKVNDLGTYSEDSCDYPEFAYKLAKAISLKKAPMGVLICKSGIGNSIAANKLPGVRAALVYNLKAAKLSRQHNDSNVLVLGSAFVPPALAKRIIKVWVATGFEGGRHKRRLDLIKKIERGIKK
ncbi:MAG: ribose 5-phosphate isomerase B [Candidatus Omnitrophica bacterium]|nr:ribose 5-phosphate isomerase B [Candidatus Omnitrophota bacterium]